MKEFALLSQCKIIVLCHVETDNFTKFSYVKYSFEMNGDQLINAMPGFLSKDKALIKQAKRMNDKSIEVGIGEFFIT